MVGRAPCSHSHHDGQEVEERNNAKGVRHSPPGHTPGSLLPPTRLYPFPLWTSPGLHVLIGQIPCDVTTSRKGSTETIKDMFYSRDLSVSSTLWVDHDNSGQGTTKEESPEWQKLGYIIVYVNEELPSILLIFIGNSYAFLFFLNLSFETEPLADKVDFEFDV